MNFKNLITSTKRIDKEIKAFESTIVIKEMTGADLMRWETETDMFLRAFDIFNSCVEQDEDDRLEIEFFSDLYKLHREEVLKTISEILILSKIVERVEEVPSKTKKK